MFESCPIVQLSDNNTDRVSGLTVRSTASECLVDGSGDPSYILVGTSFLLESLALVDGSGDPSYSLRGSSTVALSKKTRAGVALRQLLFAGL